MFHVEIELFDGLTQVGTVRSVLRELSDRWYLNTGRKVIQKAPVMEM